MWSFDGGFSIPADASGHLAIEYTWIYKPSVLWNRIAGNNEGIQRWNHRSFTKVWLFSQQSLKGMCVCLKIRYPKFTGSSSVSLWRVPRLWANPMSWNQSKSWSTVGLGSAQGLLGKRLHGAVHRWRCFVSPALNSKISMPMSRSKRWRTSNLDQIKPHMAPLCHENSGFHPSKIWILTTNVFVIWNLISKHHGF